MSLAVAELSAVSTRVVGARVVFFLQGERVPAARFRGHAIVAALRAAGLPCAARVPSPSVPVDTRLLRQLPGQGAKGPEAVVGWTGGSGNYPHLGSAVPGIVRALERTGARFRIISDRPPPRAVAPLEAEFVRWSPEREVEDLAAIDVG